MWDWVIGRVGDWEIVNQKIRQSHNHTIIQSHNLLRTQLRKEVHLERVRQLRRRAEGEVHVLVQHLRDVRPRDLHPTRKLRLRDAKLLHPQQYLPQKRRSALVNRLHIFQSKPLRALIFAFATGSLGVWEAWRIFMIFSETSLLIFQQRKQ